MSETGINDASGALFTNVGRNYVGGVMPEPVDRDQVIQTGILTVTNSIPGGSLSNCSLL